MIYAGESMAHVQVSNSLYSLEEHVDLKAIQYN